MLQLPLFPNDLDSAVLAAVVAQLALDHGTVRWTSSARTCARSMGITMLDVVNVIRGGLPSTLMCEGGGFRMCTGIMEVTFKIDGHFSIKVVAVERYNEGEQCTQ